MLSRRIFLKNGGLALVSLGFAPGVRGAHRGGRRRAPEDAHRDLSARRGRRPEHGRPLRRARLLRGAADDCHPAARRPAPGHRDRSRRLLRPAPAHGAARAVLVAERSLAIVHACGSPDHTRSHFDAQDYMESGTPGVKSTEDGWLNRYLKAQGAGRGRRRSARSRSTSQLPRTLQGSSPALAMTRIQHFGLRGGDAVHASFEQEYAAAADRVLAPTGQEAFDADAPAEVAPTRSAISPKNGAQYPRSRVRRGAAADRAAREGRRRPRSGVRRIGPVGSPRQRRRRRRPARQSPRRLLARRSPRSPPISARACRTSSS